MSVFTAPNLNDKGILQKLLSFIRVLRTHLFQKLEKLRENPGVVEQVQIGLWIPVRDVSQ
jgi:hypothetical protein